MALPTWEEMLTRSRLQPTGVISLNPAEAKKAFDWLIENSDAPKRWGKLSKKSAMINISSLIRMHLTRNKGKFVLGPGAGSPGVLDAQYRWNTYVKKNPTFPEVFETYLKKSKLPEVRKISLQNISLEEKYNRLPNTARKSARFAFTEYMKTGKSKGMISLRQFMPFTNFTEGTLLAYLSKGLKPSKEVIANNWQNVSPYVRGKQFVDFLKKNNIEIFRRQKIQGGDYYFTDPNASQRTALTGFLNLKQDPSTYERHILQRASRNHPLYKDTSQNLKTILKSAQKNLNDSIKGFNNKGLREFMKQYPRVLKNATMKFDPITGKLAYTSLSDIYKKGYDLDKLRRNLKFELDHNRSVNDYWRNLNKDGKINAKKALLTDVEFAHNLSLKTSNYNRYAKEQIQRWIEDPINKTKTTQIAAIDKELADLGHRYYAGGKFRGAPLVIKSGYRETVLDSWSKALEKSTGLKWSDQIKKVSQQRWGMAMKEVTMKPDQLRMLGNLFGCPQTFKGLDEGGRVRLQAGGQGLSACVSTKLKQPGALEKIAALPEEVGGALGKLKKTATSFLGMLGRGGVKAAPYAALAAVGAGIEPLVRQFRNDDPSTYLTDESQMKGMLLATIEGETPKVDEEILKWQYPGLGAATAAGAIPGAGEVYKARRSGVPLDKSIGPLKGVGKTRAALGITGVLGKALGATFSPLAVAATLPVHIAAQRAGGTDYGDIATDPMNWLGPAFASTGAEMATRGMKSGSRIANAIRLGFSPRTLSMFTRRFGLPGLAVSAGMWGYDKWKNRSVNDPDE